MRTYIFFFYKLCLSLIINSAVGAVTVYKEDHPHTTQPIASDSYTYQMTEIVSPKDQPKPCKRVKQNDSYTYQVTEIVSPKDQPKSRKRVKVSKHKDSTNNFFMQDKSLTSKENTEEDNIVPALKFEECTVTPYFNDYPLDLYNQYLRGCFSSEEKRFIGNARCIIPMYYEKALVNKRGEYKIWGKKVDFIQLTIQVANLDRLSTALFGIYDKAYKRYLFSRRNKTNEDNNKTDEVNNKIKEIFNHPKKLSLDQLDFQLDFLPENDRSIQMNILIQYFNDKKKFNESLNDKLQSFYLIWRKMIFKNTNEYLFKDKTNASYGVLANIGVDNFIKQIEEVKELLEDLCSTLEALTNEYTANGQELTLEQIVNFNDETMDESKKVSIRNTYARLRNNWYITTQFLDKIDDALKSLVIEVVRVLGNSYSFQGIKNISDPLTEMLTPVILSYRDNLVLQLINFIINSVYFTDRDLMQDYLDDLNRIKNGLELIEESLCY